MIYPFLLEAHSGWRWIVLVVLVVTTLKVLIGWLGRQRWRRLDTNLIFLARIALYVQVGLGVLLYLLSQRWNDMQFTGEHVIIALLAVGGVEFAAARAKKSRGRKMFTFALIGFAIALILVYVALQAVGGVLA